MTSTADTMLDGATKPWDRVPDELWEDVLSHLVTDRKTLRAVARANCPASNQARRLYWRNDLAAPRLVEELQNYPHDDQQAHANHIHHATMRFKPTSQRRLSGNFTLDNIADETGTLFPSLETLQLGKVRPSNLPGRQHQDFVEQDWADQVAKDLDRHAPKLHWIHFCLDEKDDIAQMAANAWWFLRDKREFRAMLEGLGTPEEEINRSVAAFTPVSGLEGAQVSLDVF